MHRDDWVQLEILVVMMFFGNGNDNDDRVDDDRVDLLIAPMAVL